MGVAALLELDEMERPLLAEADRAWSSWAAEFPPLRSVGSVGELRPWLRQVPPAEADEVLWALARLGSPSGGGRVAASAVVAWCLLPGACALAHQLRTVSAGIDELVAGRLWIEVRSFRWERLRRVAANILAETRSAVLRECGVPSRVRRTDRAWSATVVLDPQSPMWQRMFPDWGGQGRSAADEVADLLGGGLAGRR